MARVTADSMDRAQAALWGIAAGDALGMPSQTLPRSDIRRHYGRIETFLPPIEDHPVSHGLDAAQVTDDTEQTLLLAQRLISGEGRIDEAAWAQDLLDWEQDVRARGLRDLLGPSSKAAIEALLAGTPAGKAGRNGTTNGAAMRIAPIGIATPASAPGLFLDRVETACRLTHNTGEAMAGAAAVAAVISQGIDGACFEDTLPLALTLSDQGQGKGYPAGVPDLRIYIEQALERGGQAMAPDAFAGATGTSVATHHSVPAAFGIVRMAEGDPWKAAQLAANIGDDTDTIGAIAAAMAAACTGTKGLPADVLQQLKAANSLPVETTAARLLDLRAQAGGAA